eukprot:TRINITY_DN27885_c0_g1_i2.p1 TRINITY_DN27885_c0_g1~~TRINITY_DN27885_c0_g1_i2.p1  ORF type:complete len:124 (+),score=20.82 TRINITY_DN27885_c0_g1_i2:47-373(+)
MCIRDRTDTLANPFWPTSILMSDDLPTFDRPINAYSGRSGAGHFLTSVLLIKKRACLIIESGISHQSIEKSHQKKKKKKKKKKKTKYQKKKKHKTNTEKQKIEPNEVE